MQLHVMNFTHVEGRELGITYRKSSRMAKTAVIQKLDYEEKVGFVHLRDDLFRRKTCARMYNDIWRMMILQSN